MKATTVPFSPATSSSAYVLPSVAGSRNSAAVVSRTPWVAVVAISHLLVSKYMLTTACRGIVSKACSRAAGQSFPVYPLIADVERGVEVAGCAVGVMLDMMIAQAQRSSPPYY